MAEILDGECLCGAIQYRIGAQPIDAGYCHCRLCQCSSGTPVMAWLTVAAEAFSYGKGSPQVYRSSRYGRREFCGMCGTQIAFRLSNVPETVDVTLPSLHEPSLVVPEYHIWRQSRVAWFETADALPRYEDAGPDDHQG